MPKRGIPQVPKGPKAGQATGSGHTGKGPVSPAVARVRKGGAAAQGRGNSK